METKLTLLQSISEQADITQRSLAQRVNLALGLTNAYLKKFVKDGLVKIEQIPANRYLYYLTPKGFAQKSKLMSQHLSQSLGVYKTIKSECLAFYISSMKEKRVSMAIIGENDLADIARLLANNYRINLKQAKLSDVSQTFADYWIVCDAADGQQAYDLLSQTIPDKRILVFSVLKVKTGEDTLC